MSREIIQKIYILVEEQCRSKENIYGYGAWKHHILPVTKYALIMSDMLEADKELVELAALLHDYASVKNKDFYVEHHIHGASLADELLTKLDYPRDKIDKIRQCIFAHRGSIVYNKLSAEEKCVADADAMAHIDQVPSLLQLAYGVKHMDVDEGVEFVRAKLERSWNKMSEEAKDIMKDKYRLALDILQS